MQTTSIENHTSYVSNPPSLTCQFGAKDFSSTCQCSVTQLVHFCHAEFLNVGAVPNEGSDAWVCDAVALVQTEMLECPRGEALEAISGQLLQFDEEKLFCLPHYSC